MVFAVGIAIVAILVAHLPSELPVVHVTRFDRSRRDDRCRRSVCGRVAGRLACGGLLVVGVGSAAFLGVGVDTNVTS